MRNEDSMGMTVAIPGSDVGDEGWRRALEEKWRLHAAMGNQRRLHAEWFSLWVSQRMRERERRAVR